MSMPATMTKSLPASPARGSPLLNSREATSAKSFEDAYNGTRPFYNVGRQDAFCDSSDLMGTAFQETGVPVG